MDVETLLGDLRRGHSHFQMDFFVTAMNGVTPWGMYQKALVEIDGRHGPLMAMICQRDNLLVFIAKWSRWPRSWFRRIPSIRRRLGAARVSIEELNQSITTTQGDYDRYVWQATQLKKEIGHVDAKRAQELDREFWYEKFKRQMVIAIVLNGRPDASTIEAIMAAPVDWRQSLMAELKRDPAELESWLLNQPALLDTVDGPLRLNVAAPGNGKAPIQAAVTAGR